MRVRLLLILSFVVAGCSTGPNYPHHETRPCAESIARRAQGAYDGQEQGSPQQTRSFNLYSQECARSCDDQHDDATCFERTMLIVEDAFIEVDRLVPLCEAGKKVACDFIAAHRANFEVTMAFLAKNKVEQEAAAERREREARATMAEQTNAAAADRAHIDEVIAGYTAQYARQNLHLVKSIEGGLDGPDKAFDLDVASGRAYWIICVAADTAPFRASVIADGNEVLAFETLTTPVPHTFTQGTRFAAEAAHPGTQIVMHTGWFGASQRVACRVFGD